MSAAVDVPVAAEPIRHNTLAAFHAGCGCGWCCSASRERTCGCRVCEALRASTFFTLPVKVSWS